MWPSFTQWREDRTWQKTKDYQSSFAHTHRNVLIQDQHQAARLRDASVLGFVAASANSRVPLEGQTRSDTHFRVCASQNIVGAVDCTSMNKPWWRVLLLSTCWEAQFTVQNVALYWPLIYHYCEVVCNFCDDFSWPCYIIFIMVMMMKSLCTI